MELAYRHQNVVFTGHATASTEARYGQEGMVGVKKGRACARDLTVVREGGRDGGRYGTCCA